MSKTKREYAEKHNIEETTFADAVNHKLENVDCGISCMHPWSKANKEVKVKKE